MKKEELEKIKNNLLKKKKGIEEIINRSKMQEDLPGNEVGDPIDNATNSQIKELDFSLKNNEIEMLKQIEITLKKIDKGEYGNCEVCKKPIPMERLKALPFSSSCIECQQKSDHRA